MCSLLLPPNSQYVLVSLCHSLLAVFVACFFSCSLSLVCLIFFSCLHFPHQLVFCLPVLCSSFHMPVHSTFSLVNHVPSMLFSCFPPGFVFQCDFSFSSSHKLLPRLSCNFSSFPYLHCHSCRISFGSHCTRIFCSFSLSYPPPLLFLINFFPLQFCCYISIHVFLHLVDRALRVIIV